MVLALLLASAQAVAANPPADLPEYSERAAYGPAAPKATARPRRASLADPCQARTPEPGVILVCGRPDTYRIDPDLLLAKRLVHNQVQQPRPPERLEDRSCQVVGTMGCINTPTINVFQAVMTAATMVKTAATGGNVGKMFVTGHELSEYELYKRARERRIHCPWSSMRNGSATGAACLVDDPDDSAEGKAGH
ncbi:hypothetical protein HMF7854_04100 [Sphingomonas ginkgonis]|uniref:Uncharacterized protein n=1 Tax=Sphingomonas ginkgonis TaxID=2315330 RepID=A0A429V8A3_9SPHN|nr:hypothetical protein [Sphingomonas ginkgonis]RST30097.1 hypothetical protein HMF7854_04100 [Sphingomonas ginkgonis]